MSPLTYSATEVKNRFGRVLRDLARMGGPIIVEKDNKPVAVILSMEEYEQAFGLQKLSAVEADSSFGMWAERPELDEVWLADGRSRWQSEWVDE